MTHLNPWLIFGGLFVLLIAFWMWCLARMAAMADESLNRLSDNPES